MGRVRCCRRKPAPGREGIAGGRATGRAAFGDRAARVYRRGLGRIGGRGDGRASAHGVVAVILRASRRLPHRNGRTARDCGD